MAPPFFHYAIGNFLRRFLKLFSPPIYSEIRRGKSLPPASNFFITVHGCTLRQHLLLPIPFDFQKKKHRTKSAQNASDVLLGSASDLVRCLVGFQSFTDPAPLARLEVFAYSTFKSCRAQNQSKTEVMVTLRFASDFLRRVEDVQPVKVLLRLHELKSIAYSIVITFAQNKCSYR